MKTLVDEFSQFARFPAAQPVRCDLNEVVRERPGGVPGRLDGIDIRMQLAPRICRRSTSTASSSSAWW